MSNISLPNVYDFKPNKLSVPVNASNMMIHAALSKGTREFEGRGFHCFIEGRQQKEYHYRMSQIGDCARKQWLWVNDPAYMEANQPQFGYRMEAIGATNLGNVLEEYVISVLRYGGLKVIGEQTEVEDVIKGHIDGIVIVNGNQYLLELKALNMNSASKIVNAGDLAGGNLLYFSQMQYYMHCLSLDAGYFIAFIKDSGQYYVEKVTADREFQLLLLERASMLKGLEGTEVINHIPDRHIVRECTFCPAKQFCADHLDGGEEAFVQLFKEYHGIE